MNKKVSMLIAVALLVLISGCVGYLLGQNSGMQKDDISDKSVIQDSELALPQIDENMSAEEIEGVVFDTYKNGNVRLVGAVVQDVQSDYITVKTYAAGPGTTSIVKERKIVVSEDVPILESSLFDGVGESDANFEKKRITLSEIQIGDSLTIECREDVSLSDVDELTAVLITKDTVFLAEPEGPEDLGDEEI